MALLLSIQGKTSLVSRQILRLKSRSCFKNHPRSHKGSRKPHPRKVLIFNDIRAIFTSSHFVAVFHHNDLSVQEWNGLRQQLDKNDILMKVLPSKIAKKALEGTKYRNMSPLLHGSTVIAYSQESNLSKLLSVTKLEPKLHLLGGLIEDGLLTPHGLYKYANLPEKTVLQQQLLITLTIPQATLSNILLDSSRRLVQLLGHHASEHK